MMTKTKKKNKQCHTSVDQLPIVQGAELLQSMIAHHGNVPNRRGMVRLVRPVP